MAGSLKVQLGGRKPACEADGLANKLRIRVPWLLKPDVFVSGFWPNDSADDVEFAPEIGVLPDGEYFDADDDKRPELVLRQILHSD